MNHLNKLLTKLRKCHLCTSCHLTYRMYSKIRNIGILAHIDAGKTTTTERMLFYSGKTRSMGEVHHGNTVTDYLVQERERGITICSSAVSFPWKDHKINLLDTPGHIDFTMEVEQSLCAIDGIVVILDSSAGVEAQTITVWTQADNHKLPRIVYANKMDRPDANFSSSLNDLKVKLNANPLPLQWPIICEKGLSGIIDILNLKELRFNTQNEGRTYTMSDLTGDVLEIMQKKRRDLIDTISGMNDELAENIILNESLENVDNSLVVKAIKQATFEHKIVPVLLGSSYKNIGVQPLIDAVVDYLPAPEEKNTIYNCFGNDFAGKVFKVIHDKQRGPLSLVRVLSGKIKKGTKIITSENVPENVQRIYEPLADEYREVNSVDNGDVGIFAGLKHTSTGDLLISNLSSLKSAQKNLLKKGKIIGNSNADDDNDHPEILSQTFGLQPKVPDAVYFCSIEPPSISQQLPLENALKQLQREDPSLRIKYDETTMQTVLGGMGELHLEIIKSRLLSEYKIDADLGPLQIAYKETLEEDIARDTIEIEKEIAGARQQVFLELSLVKGSDEIFRVDTSPEATQNMATIRPRTIFAVKKGAVNALDRGPRIGGQVVDTQIILHNIRIGRGTADSFLMAAAAQCIQKILLNAGCRLLEPMMSIQIISPSDRVSKILSDLGKRRAIIQDVIAKGQTNKIINTLAPLSELSGYSSTLRTITSGGASMTMQPNGYALMSSNEEDVAIRRCQGFE